MKRLSKKRLSKVYTYTPADNKVVEHKVEHQTADHIAVRCGIACQLVHRDQLDTHHYFTKPELAVKSFIDFGKQRLADKTIKLSKISRAGWDEALVAANRLLTSLLCHSK